MRERNNIRLNLLKKIFTKDIAFIYDVPNSVEYRNIRCVEFCKISVKFFKNNKFLCKFFRARLKKKRFTSRYRVSSI